MTTWNSIVFLKTCNKYRLCIFVHEAQFVQFLTRKRPIVFNVTEQKAQWTSTPTLRLAQTEVHLRPTAIIFDKSNQDYYIICMARFFLLITTL